MSVGIFSLLLLLAGLLFLAGALVLPSGEAEYPADLAEYFTIDGSWGAGAIALFNFTALVAIVITFNGPLADPSNFVKHVPVNHNIIVSF